MNITPHFLANENVFSSFIKSFSCNGCKFFIDKKCTQANSVQNDIDKIALVKAYEKMANEGWIATPPPVSKAREEMLNSWIEMGNTIDDYFICYHYDSKN